MSAVDELARAIDDRTAGGIARTVARLVDEGAVPIGSKLPPIRALAKRLGVSPTTVSAAWQSLVGAGVLETHGRLGTTVRAVPRSAAPTRFSRLQHCVSGAVVVDLAGGTPDPELLPDLREAIRDIGRRASATSYFASPVLPELEAVLRADWPFDPQAMTIVDGAMDAIDRIFDAGLRYGVRVLVENPTFPPILDLLEQRGVVVDGLPLDEDGIRVDALRAALATRPAAALVLQPRAQNPTGHTMTARRADQLAQVLRARPETLVIEDDHGAALSNASPVSIGAHLPDRTVHIRGFSKSHGPDLRLAAVGGCADVVGKVVRRRLLGPAWSSRLLQDVLRHLLTDADSIAQVALARETYAARRLALTRELVARDVTVTGTDGINLWIEVADERSALLNLSVQGVVAAPGTPFLSAPLPAEHIRITCATVAGDPAALAEQIARAAGPAPARYTV
jgi:DNA-binding transcriptional MocR family regulator